MLQQRKIQIEGNLKAATSLATSSMFQPALGLINITTIPTNIIKLHLPKTFIKIFEPGVEDRVVAHPVLAVHDEDRVGRKAAPHLQQPTHCCQCPL